MREKDRFFYTICCFHPDARKAAGWPLAVIEFEQALDGDVFLQDIWWPDEDVLRFLESQTNSVLLKASLLTFPQSMTQGILQYSGLIRENLPDVLSKIVGSGNFSFTEMKATENPLTQEQVRQNMEKLVRPPVYQKIPVPA